MMKRLIILQLTCTSIVVRGLTKVVDNTCLDKNSGEFYCCSNYEEFNGKCVECKPGFQSRNGNACIPCLSNLFGNGCSQVCNCNDLQKCDNAVGCVDKETTSTLEVPSHSYSAKYIISEGRVTMAQKDEHNYECKLGFKSRRGSSCEPCVSNYFGGGCSNKCLCKNTQRCDNVKGCVEIGTTITRTLTTKSDTAEAISSEHSVTKVNEEEQNNDISKTELLMLYTGASSAIFVLLGMIGITKCLKKRIRLSISRRVKPTEEEEHLPEEHRTLEAFALHESVYEIIDESHLDIVLVQQTFNRHLEYDDESRSSGSSANRNIDRSSYLDPVSNHVTKKSMCQKEKQIKKTFPTAKQYICIENQMVISPNLESDGESSISEITTNCNVDRSNSLPPVSSLIVNDISCNTEEESRKVLLSANNSTCIAEQTSCDPYLAIEVDVSDDSSSEFSKDATHDRSSYLHPYNTLFNKTNSCHIYEICQNEPSSE